MSEQEIFIQPHQTEAIKLMLRHQYTLLYGGARCLDPCTDILTPSGYKKLSEVKIGDKVCSLSNQKIVERTVLSVYKSYVKEAIHVSSPYSEFICSLDHRLLFNGEFQTADYISNKVSEIEFKTASFTSYWFNNQPFISRDIDSGFLFSRFPYNGEMIDIEVSGDGNFIITEEKIISHNSGKTWIILFFNLFMANIYDPEEAASNPDYPIKKPSRHLIVRHHFSDVKKSIIRETLPDVARLMGIDYKLNQQDWYIELPNGSEIWFGGVDEGRGLDRVLGKEYLTIWFNECSQVSYSVFWFLMSRLAQETGLKNRHMCYEGMDDDIRQALGWIGVDADGNDKFDGYLSEMSTRVFLDENPPSKAHWTYKVFFEGIDPDKRTKIPNREDYAVLKMSPIENKENIAKNFMERLENAPEEYRKRFLDGEFADEIKGSLFNEATINKYRVNSEQVPELIRVVVAVDPATTSNPDTSDECGIEVMGLGKDRKAYQLADLSGVYTPKEWAQKVCDAYVQYDAECVVAEVNQGGEMVRHTIQSYDENIPVKTVHALKGKVLRAQPVSVYMEQGKVCHVGAFPDLENEMCTYTGEGKSPNRLDAYVYGVLYFFPVGINKQKEPFSEERITFFNEEFDISKMKSFAVIKIADGENYRFAMIVLKSNGVEHFVTNIIFNEDLPAYNIPEIEKTCKLMDVSKLIIECDISYAEFTRALKNHLVDVSVRGAKLPKDETNRIIIESDDIRKNVSFWENPMSDQYSDFLKELNFYTNLSTESERFAASVTACASSMIKKFKDEYKNPK